MPMALRLGLGLDLGLSEGAVANLAPTDIAWAGTHTVDEDAELGEVVGGALSAVDPELQAVTFTLTDDAGGRFAIGASGTSVIVSGVLDFETSPTHTITVRATDSEGGVYDEQFVVTVNDVPEAPPAEDPPPDDGEVEEDDPAGYDNPPYVVVVDDGIKFAGKKKNNGSLGKFIYDIGPFLAGYKYTMRYDPDWSLLENGGVTAMVGFGLKDGNDFHLAGLKGDGSSGLDAFIVHGTNWTSTSGHTTSNEGDAANGTQGGPNWLQIEFSADGTSYTLRTSADGVDWDDETTAEAPVPLDDTADATAGGIAVMFDVGDAGHFSVKVDLWIEEAAGDPHFANVVFLAGFEGVDGATSYTEEKNSRASQAFNGNAQLDTAQFKFGAASLLMDGTGDSAQWADNVDYDLSDANSSQFTIEFWARWNGISAGTRGILGQWGSVGNRGWALSIRSGDLDDLNFGYTSDGSTIVDTGTTAGGLTTGSWFHIAVDKDSGGKIRIYVNGVMKGSATPANSAFFNSTNPFLLGVGQGADGNFNGWMDELRITKGVARYASDSGFTVPAEAFPRS